MKKLAIVAVLITSPFTANAAVSQKHINTIKYNLPTINACYAYSNQQLFLSTMREVGNTLRMEGATTSQINEVMTAVEANTLRLVRTFNTKGSGYAGEQCGISYNRILDTMMAL